jgi:molybdopterin molybdotransferase
MSEMNVSQLLTVDQAIAIIDAAEVQPRVVSVSLAEAQGLRLAEDVVADRDYPPFDKSLMDGYAVRCADVAHPPVELAVVDEIPAGRAASVELKPQQAMAIMTGAPLPQGADCVVPVEATRLAGNVVRINVNGHSGRYIARRGSDCAAGAVVLCAGARLEAAPLAVAASVGKASVQVYAPPRVGVLSTGDEVVTIEQEPVGGQIRNSNNIMLLALLRRMGCEAIDLGHVHDVPDAIRERIEQGLQHDALLITGGMSMGRYDYVPHILREMKAEMLITKLRIKPGKPFVFAAVRERFVFGLPGNPVSGFACTVRLVSRLLVRMAGGQPEPRWLHARLAVALPANGPREFYQPGVLREEQVEPLPWKGSADIYTLAKANVLLVRPENQPSLAAGDLVRVLEIPHEMA